MSDEQHKEQEQQRVQVVPLLPIRDIIVFPHMVVPLFVGREKSIAALEEAMNKKLDILLAAQKKAKTNEPMEEDIFEIGTLSSIIQLLRLPDGTIKVLIEGKQRARIVQFVSNNQFFQVEVEKIDEIYEQGVEMEALVRSLKGTFENYVKLNKRIPPEMLISVASIEDPGRLADTIVAHLNLKLEDKQKILETANVSQRIEELFGLMQSEIEILQIERKIRSRVKKQMEKSQKEYYLNEQMQAIQKELGERDEFKAEILEYEKKLKSKKLSKEAHNRARKEIRKLKMMSPMSAEATVVRNYIDWMLSLPWDEHTDDRIELKDAHVILDEDHYGLDKVKERILEYLAVQKAVGKLNGPILCLIGPPGVGKTSLAKSIARATRRKFVRASLGGVRDEAEIRGHRRTYIGALPGKIIQSMKKAGYSNPVFLLDEVDKMSMDFRGDPSSALLEVLDPEQNNTFMDHYLEVEYDLSDVMFVTTANSLHAIPKPLLDRMEVIMISGYTHDEKLEIAKRHLVPKQLNLHGLTPAHVQFTEGALVELTNHYTRESGVRNLQREIGSLCRKITRQLVSDGPLPENPEKPVKVVATMVEKYLGPKKFRTTQIEEQNNIGLVNGMAYTDTGGDLLSIEVSTVPGTGKLIVTGQLGDVMQESAKTAMSYVRSRANLLGLPYKFYQENDVHIHVPEGAIPKDGPSAGISMATSIISALTRRTVHRDVAMTGEITLRGRVLPIGGLKEKLLAAHRGSIKTVIIPKDNEKDLIDMPPKVLKALKVILVNHMDEVLPNALVFVEGEDLFTAPSPAPLSLESQLSTVPAVPQ
ncbi:MAG TPA: endopeptidase La [Bdellovibrionota bacterium]|nr:endopeptidase La [Bdellovibrionota bacterium]